MMGATSPRHLDRSPLHRLLAPRSVAVVGASERRRMSNVSVGHLLTADVTLHLVNPGSPAAYGRATVASLAAIGEPVDAVLSLVGADAAVEVVEQAAALACGGVVVVASGFAEAGASGTALQDRLVVASRSGAVAVIGPNCSGFANIADDVALFTGTAVPVPAGGVSIVSQSGYLTRASMVAARERNLGVRLAISSGNEAVTGLAELLDFLVDDPDTQVICLVLETVRDHEAFFAAIARARIADKPVIALKLGSSDRGRQIMQSHTGAIATESWVYEVGLRQAGVILATDLEDLLDRTQLLAQLPPDRWRSARRVAVIASSGGVAALASDLVTGEAVQIPALDHLRGQVRQTIPGAPYANPLDLTGFAVEPPEVVENLLQVFTNSGDVDAVVVGWWTSDEDEDRAEMFLEPLRNVARRGDVPMIMASVEASRIGTWTTAAGSGLVSFTRGLRGTARALTAMSEQVEGRGHRGPRPKASAEAALLRPAGVASPAGPMVGFADAMELLRLHQVPVAPFVVVDDPTRLDLEVIAALGDRFVVKLADVPHRGAIGAVRIGVTLDEVPTAARELTALATSLQLPTPMVIQPMVVGRYEAFAGGRNHTDLGAVVLVGEGGVSVERGGRVTGRLIPVASGEVEAMFGELREKSSTSHPASHATADPLPVPNSALAEAVLGVADLLDRAPWIASIDVNPLICDEEGCTAVDALIVMTPDQTAGTGDNLASEHGSPGQLGAGVDHGISAAQPASTVRS